jgi:nitrate/TMAO reductase-like tetraheme cytochrome c subunit
MGTPHGPSDEQEGHRSRFRGRRLLASAILAGIVSAPVGWMVTDRLEQDNDLCTSCHLTSRIPLHSDIRKDFDTAAPVSLASVHGTADPESGTPPAGLSDAGFRCIDCHGGVSFVGRARVKALAAKDAFWYLVGRFEEPDGMRWPLWDEDCSRCHADFDENDAEPWRQPRFHQLPVHNVELGVNCVECHLVHETGGSPEAYFLRPPLVRSQCARCHSEFEEG